MKRWKVLGRTLRTFVRRTRPYYAHLCVTERCNLRCRCCQVWKLPSKEIQVKQWKEIVDKMERMGVAFLIFTGGEPLLYRGIFELIDYAAATGLVTAITSNGVLDQRKYAQLLETGIDKLTISQDGVHGEDLPYSHTSARIIENIQFIRGRRGDKRFTLSTVRNGRNRKAVSEVSRFSACYKLSIVQEANRCTKPGEIGALLRREGLYSSHLSKWRRQHKQRQLAGLSSQKRGRKPEVASASELAALQQENAQGENSSQGEDSQQENSQAETTAKAGAGTSNQVHHAIV